MYRRGPAPLQGLILWWLPWAGPTGSCLIDRSNANNNGDLINFNATQGWVVDGTGWALEFDDVNDRVLTTNASLLNQTTSRRQLTFSIWAKTTAASIGTLVGCGTTTANNPIIWLRNDTTDATKVRWQATTGGSSPSFDITSTTSINTGAWFHVCGVASPDAARLYINGIEEGSVGYSQNMPSTLTGIQLGATRRPSVGNFFGGYLDDFRIYNRGLTSPEVQQLYLLGRGAGFRESTVAKYNFASTQNISLNAIAATTTVYDPTVTATAAISLDTIAATTSVYNPTVIPGAVTISLNEIAATTTVYNPTVNSSANIFLNTIAATGTVYDPTLTAGAVTISLNTIAATTTVYSPTVLATSSIVLDAIAATTTVYNPTVTATAAIILDAIAATTQVYQPTIFASGTTQNINLNLIPATTVVYNPSLSSVSNDTSDILERGLKRLRQEEENLAAQILKKRQKKEPRKVKKPTDWKKEILAQINGAQDLATLEAIDLNAENVKITAKILASIEKAKEAKRQELLEKQLALQKAIEEQEKILIEVVKAEQEAAEFERKQNIRKKRLKALMWLAKLDL